MPPIIQAPKRNLKRDKEMRPLTAVLLPERHCARAPRATVHAATGSHRVSGWLRSAAMSVREVAGFMRFGDGSSSRARGFMRTAAPTAAGLVVKFAFLPLDIGDANPSTPDRHPPI
jgi:hypothetical protein